MQYQDGLFGEHSLTYIKVWRESGSLLDKKTRKDFEELKFTREYKGTEEQFISRWKLERQHGIYPTRG